MLGIDQCVPLVGPVEQTELRIVNDIVQSLTSEPQHSLHLTRCHAGTLSQTLDALSNLIVLFLTLQQPSCFLHR